MLSDPAARRLVHYCVRAPLGPPEYVDRGHHHVRYVNRQLRLLVWADTEVRDVLLEADDEAVWQALVAQLNAHAPSRGLDLLDLAAAMTLEAERTAAA